MPRFLLSFAIIAMLVAPTRADRRPKAAATVALTTSSISGTGPALVKKVKKASASRAVFFAGEDGWNVHYALAVPSALPASEITLKISDISRGKQPICTRHKFIYNASPVTRGQFTLTRDDVVSPNAKLLLEIESDGEPIARQTFFIQGKVATGPAIVDFSEEEADGDDEMDVASKRR